MSPEDRILAYFDACSTGTTDDIASNFTEHATVFDTNVPPVCGAHRIGVSWVKIRNHWLGAHWEVDSYVGDAKTAAIEWSMTGINAPTNVQPDGLSFTFRGSEHYRFEGDENLISEIRQYWVFDPSKLETGLVGFSYPNPG